MRGSKLAAFIIMLTITALVLLLLTGFRQNLLANGSAYISSVLDTHLTQDAIAENKGRIIDRENLEWPALPADAEEMLAHWENPQEAENSLESIYYLIYNGKDGIANLESRELLGIHSGGFNAKDGIRDLYAKKGHDVYITISGAFTGKLYHALKSSGAVNGSAVLSNYKTGEILAWASFPSDSDLFSPAAGNESAASVQPYQLSLLISSVANNGKASRPYIVSRVVSREDGGVIQGVTYDIPGYLDSPYLDLTRRDAPQLKAFMKGVCAEGGKAAELGAAMKKIGYTAAAQTGSAAVLHTGASISWVACFLEEKPFVLTVALQGAGIAAPVKIAADMLPVAVEMNLDSPQFP